MAFGAGFPPPGFNPPSTKRFPSVLHTNRSLCRPPETWMSYGKRHPGAFGMRLGKASRSGTAMRASLHSCTRRARRKTLCSLYCRGGRLIWAFNYRGEYAVRITWCTAQGKFTQTAQKMTRTSHNSQEIHSVQLEENN